MKVLGICGSHRKESTTFFFLKKALEVCEKEGLETEIVTLAERDIGPCTVCDACAKEFSCTVKDDMQELYDKMAGADALIIASPTYYGMVSGKLKNMFDRSLPLRRNGFKLGKKIGGSIAVGASRNGGQELVSGQIQRWMGFQGMMTVTDAKTAHFGGVAWVPRGSRPEDDKIGVETCENLGRKIVETLKLLGI
jgi:multimeric flavodoxin WrbA